MGTWQQLQLTFTQPSVLSSQHEACILFAWRCGPFNDHGLPRAARFARGIGPDKVWQHFVKPARLHFARTARALRGVLSEFRAARTCARLTGLTTCISLALRAPYGTLHVPCERGVLSEFRAARFTGLTTFRHRFAPARVSRQITLTRALRARRARPPKVPEKALI